MALAAEISPELRAMAASCPEALTDEELMRVLISSRLSSPKSAAECEGLFSELFRRYQNRVTAWCFRLTRNRGTARDLAQEVFLKAHRHIHRFRGDSKLSTWLYAIARNHSLSALRKMASDPVEHSEAMPPRLRDHTALAPDRSLEREQLSRRVWKMLESTLEPMEVRVVTLHYGYDIPLATITQRLALSNASGAKAYVVNARRKLNSVIRRRGLNSDLLHSNRMPQFIGEASRRANPDSESLRQTAA